MQAIVNADSYICLRRNLFDAAHMRRKQSKDVGVSANVLRRFAILAWFLVIATTTPIHSFAQSLTPPPATGGYSPEQTALFLGVCEQYGGALECKPGSQDSIPEWHFGTEFWPYWYGKGWTVDEAEKATEASFKVTYQPGGLPAGCKFELNRDSPITTLFPPSKDLGRVAYPWVFRINMKLSFELPNGDCVLNTTTFSGFGYWRPASAYCPAGWIPDAHRVTCVRPPIDCCQRIGNPIDTGTGEKIQTEVDIPPIVLSGLSFSRTYRSQGFLLIPGIDTTAMLMGPLWRHNYQRELVYRDGTRPVAYIVGATGEHTNFKKINGVWQGRSHSSERLVDVLDAANQVIGWRYTKNNDTVEEYDVSGRVVSITDRAGVRLSLVYTDGTTSLTGGAVATDSPPNAPAAVPAGVLRSVTDSFGRTLTFDYQLDGTLVRVTDPAGQSYTYTYDHQRRLKVESGPDGASRLYVYYSEENLPSLGNSDQLLTGIVDENGIRFATFGYDSMGRATTTEHAGGTNKYTVTYSWYSSLPTDAGASATGSITDPLNTVTSSKMVMVNGIYRNGGETRPCSAPGCIGTDSTSIGYDANGNVAYRVDFKGNRTNFGYDLARALETSRTEGLTATGGTTAATRTITKTWHPTFRLPATIVETGSPGGTKTTTYTYDGSGNLTQKTVITPQGSRTWSWTYDLYGRMLTATDPRNNTSTNTYYPNDPAQGAKRGMLAAVTNAAGHTTTITSYNANGQPLSVTDPNGLVSTMVYDARQRLTSRTVGDETTTYQYDPVGQLTKVILPDASYLSYTYDAAHRLVQIQDGLGNRMVYTLDNMGNRIKEDAIDPSNALARTRSRVYDPLNRLKQDIGGADPSAEILQYVYDANGNQVSITDPLSRIISNTYDALNRLTQVTDPASGTTLYQYDAQNNLVQVTDPKGLVTSYIYNGFNELASQISPDTNTTSFTYDAAGNLLTKTDARNVTAIYGYDNLNRLTVISYPDEMVGYTYDNCANGKGRLCLLTDKTGTTTYSYDLHGRVMAKSQTVNGFAQTVAYGYNGSGQLTSMTLPSGKEVNYTYANNRITGISFDGQPVLKNADYEPFGPVGEWTWGNDIPGTPNKHTRYFDLSGRTTKIESGNAIDPAVIVYDAASRITALQKLTGNAVDPAKSTSYDYDNLDRLTAVTPGTGNTAANQSYTYDAIGNRLSNTIAGSVTNYSYGGNSHRLNALTGAITKSYTYDAVGNRIGDGAQTWTYGGNNRPTLVNVGTTSVQSGINALGQRVTKTVGGVVTRFVYDEAGRLIGEYDIDGAPIQETLWLNDVPVAVIK